MSKFDNWLLNQADEYYEDCEPKVINFSEEFEYFDENGKAVITHTPIFNCESCDEKDCEFWSDYNN